MRTNGARCVWACSTSRTSAAYALSPPGRSARTSNGAPAFAEPLSTGIPRDAVSGSGSPLSVLVSITASALIERAVDRHDLAGADERRRRRCCTCSTGHLLAAGRRRAAARPSGRAARARSARGARAGRRSPRARRRRRTSARSTTPASSWPSASAPTIATSAIVSTPRLCSTTIVRPTSTASSAASSATAARHTASPVAPRPSRCSRPPTDDRAERDRRRGSARDAR